MGRDGSELQAGMPFIQQARRNTLDVVKGVVFFVNNRLIFSLLIFGGPMLRKKWIFLLISLGLFCSKAQDKSNNLGEAGYLAVQNQFQFPPDVTATNPPVSAVASSEALPVRGILAISSISIGEKASINSDVTVIGACSGAACAAKDAELRIGEKAVFSVQNKIKANRIRIEEKANVPARLEANSYVIGRQVIAPNRNPLGLLPELPPFLSGTPGAADPVLTVTPLLAGNYRNLVVHEKRSLVLAGGFYHFKDVTIAEKASLSCAASAQCIILVKGRLRISGKAIVRSASGISNDLMFYVESAGYLHHAAALVGENAHIIANIYAAHAQLRINEKVTATGIFIGKSVKIGEKVNITGSAAPADTVAKLFQAGTPGSIELPSGARLDIPACALTSDALISITANAELGVHKVTPANLRIHSGMQFDLQPSGLTFNCPAALTLNYNAATIQTEGGNLATARVWTSQDDRLYYPVTSQQAAASSTLVASINHFTFYVVGSFAATGNYVFNIDKVNQYDYISNWIMNGGVTIFDSTNPAASFQSGNLNIGTSGCTSLGVFNAVARVGNYVYASQWCEIFPNTDKLHIIDVGNSGSPTSPVYVGSLNYPVGMGGVRRFAKSGSVLFAIGSDGTNNYLVKIDPSVTPTTPTFVTTVIPNPASALAVDSGFVYVPQSGAISIYDAATLSLQGTTAGFPGSVTEVQISGNRIYAVDMNGALTIAQLSTPTNITGLQSLSVANPVGISVASMDVSLGRIIIGGYLSTPAPNGSRVLVGYTDNYPAAPTLVDSIVANNTAMFGSYEQIKVNGNFVYAAAYTMGHEVLDISAIAPVPAPTVLATNPAAADINVAASTPIVVTFSRAMNPVFMTTTGCSGLIQVSADGFATCVPMAANLAAMSSGNTVATLTPASALTAGATYQIKVSRFVQDAQGFNLATDFTLSPGFTVQLAVVPTGWYSVTSGTSTHLNSVAFVPGGSRAYAAGDSGVLLQSADSGETWSAAAITAGTQRLIKVQFTSSTTGYVVGESNIYQTANASAASPAWSDITSNAFDTTSLCGSGLGGALRSASFIDANTGYVTCGRLVIKTTTGGASWSLSHTTPSVFQSFVAFFDSFNGALFAGAQSVYTADGGATPWIPATTTLLPGFSLQGFPRALLYVAPNLVLGGGSFVNPYGQTIRVSLDGGNNYFIPNVAGQSANMFPSFTARATLDFAAPNVSNLYAVGYDNSLPNIAVILKSTDGGLNWGQQVSPVSQILQGTGFSTATLGLAVGRNGTIIKTQTGGI